MNPLDPNVQMVEAVARALGDLRDELVFVGGCAAGLLCTSPQAVPSRVTYDVDVVAEVTTLARYYELERRFSRLGFVRDVSPDAPICRWRLGQVMVDLMPTDERVLGFSNRWYRTAVNTALLMQLPGGSHIRLIAAPAFLATKFEAFVTRGAGDMMASHDFEDIIHVLEGRPGIENEVTDTEPELTRYLATRFRAVAAHPDFENTLPGLIAHDPLYDARLETVRRRILAIASLSIE